MDDLAAELQLRGLEPPYGAVEQDLANRSAQTSETERKRTVVERSRGKSGSSCERTTDRSSRRPIPSPRAATAVRDSALPFHASSRA
jgi:hypothetical protein